MRIDALVFDFDGLLMDTETASLRAWQHIWAHHGLELDIDSFFAPHGGDMNEIRYTALAEAVGPSFDRAESHHRRMTYRDGLHAELPMAPGIEPWLTDAHARGLRMAIASSSPRHWVEMHLSRVRYLDRFELLACGDEVNAVKPDPAVYLLALSRLDVPAGNAMAFEDTVHGVAAAKGAGLRCVAIPHAHVDPALFTGADVVLRSATDATLAEVMS